LIQERLYTDPWKMFVAVLLLNKTTGRAAFPVMWELFKRWDTPEKMAKANFHELRELVKDLGLGNKRPVTLIRFSQEWLARPPSEETMAYKKGYKKQYPHETAIAHLYGMGPYAFDCWRIFCEKSSSEAWRSVRPTDKELRKYLRWRWA
ncbi:DNA glycosylase, partial [Saitoella complicata NRRL Y-17804]